MTDLHTHILPEMSLEMLRMERARAWTQGSWRPTSTGNGRAAF